MPRARFWAACLIVLGVVGVAAAASVTAQESLVGTWVGQTQVPDQGTDEVTLTLKKTDAGFAGTVSDSLGVIDGAAEVKNLTVADNALTGSFALGNGSTVTLKLKLDGGSLKGKWQHESGDTGDLTLERKAPK